MNRTAFHAAFAAVAALFIAGATRAQPQTLAQLPQVVVTGKSLAAVRAVQLPRVAVEGRSGTPLVQLATAKPARRV